MVKSILNYAKDKKICTYDLFGKKHQQDLSKFKFRISVYGVLLKDRNILLQRHPLMNNFCLPGGGIELGELISTALIREFWEETGIKIKVEDLIDVSQDFFTNEWGKSVHSILLFYKVRKISGTLTTNNDDSAEVKYFNLNELKKSQIQRIFWPIINKIK